MKLKINDLYQYQKELDSRIFTLHNINREASRRSRILALLVELAEMSNETRCFKYWSVKKSSEKEIVLEEYGDGIHFLLSLGIDLGDDSEYIEGDDVSASGLVEAILDVFESVNKLQVDFCLQNYYVSFSKYLSVAKLLGFTADEIREYYLLKNQKNHERQNTNY